MGIFNPPIGYRIPYDTDGSTGFYFNSGTSTPSVYNAGHLAIINNETSDTPVAIHRTTRYHGIIFAHLWDIDGYYINMRMDHSSQYLDTFAVSSDTTNGVDGTWTTELSSPAYNDDASYHGYWRNSANAIAPIMNVKGVRFRAWNNDSHGIENFHLYGVPSVGENPDLLIFWKPSTDSDAILLPEELDPGDEGDIQRSQSYTKTFRIKNNSATLTATDVIVSCEMLTDNSPSIQASYSFSYAGSPLATTATIPSIAPGGLSGDVTVQLDVPSNAVNRAISPRFRAVPTTYA